MTIRADRSWAVLAWIAAIVVVLGLTGITLTRGLDPVTAGLGVLMLVAVWRERGSHLTLDAHGVTAVMRRRRHSYRWDELLELGWAAQGPVSGLVARPTGGLFDDPGPNHPAWIFVLPRSGRRAAAEAREALAAWCQHTGVAYAVDGQDMELNAPPGSPYRTARGGSAAWRWLKRRA